MRQCVFCASCTCTKVVCVCVHVVMLAFVSLVVVLVTFPLTGAVIYHCHLNTHDWLT